MKKFLRIVSSLLILTIVFTGFIQFSHSYAVEFKYDETILRDIYYLGEKIVLPNAHVVVEDKNYDTKKVVYYPSGKVFTQNELTVNEIGKYEIEYRATISGKVYKEKAHFVVNKHPFTTNIDTSHAIYGKDSSNHNTRRSGITVSLSPGDIFTYNKIIDLTKLSNDDPFVEMFVLPESGAGHKEVSKLYIELVDIYDSSNFVRISGSVPDDDGGSTLWWQNNLYVQAGISNDYSVGIEWASGKIHTNNKWGFPIKYSMYGMEDGVNSVGDQMLKFFIDLDTKRVFGPSGINNQYITDLSDPTLYSKTWDGFTTGEVYLRIAADSYQYESFNFMVTKIGLHNLGEEIEDKEGPRINIDFGEYSLNTLPKGKAGNTYPIFTAEAIDSYTGKSKVITKAWRNYHSSQRYELNITNGRFKTEDIGTYYIEYTSYDKYQNRTVEIVEVEVLDSGSTPDLELDLTDVQIQTAVGKQVEIASYEILNEGIGSGSVEIFAMINDTFTKISNNIFVPHESGEYKIIYRLTDFTGQAIEKEYSLTVTVNNDPVFLNHPNLPDYIIADFEYEIPQLYAHDYISEEDLLSEIFITDGQNDDYKLTDSSYIFKKTTNEFVTIKYSVTSETGASEVSYQIPIIKVHSNGNLKLENYFDTNTFLKSATRQSLTLTTLLGTNNANFNFINPLSSENFNLNFTVGKNKDNFNKIEFTMTDMINKEESIKFTFEKSGNSYLIYINNDLTPFNIGESLSNEGEINLYFSNKDKEFSINNGLPFIVRNYLNGKTFNGFSSKKVYLKGELKDITKESNLIIYNINGQAITNDSEDFVRPTIYIDGEYQSVYKLDEIATVFKAYSFDVISPNVVGSITVRDSKNNLVKDINGLELNNVPLNRNYSLQLSSYGNYLVTYYLNDGSGMSDTRFTYTMFVDDNIKPEITISGTNKNTAKIGEKINIFSASALDNLDGEVEVYYYIYTPKGIMTALSKNDLTYTFKESGSHTIIYMAIDESGNMATLENIVNVSR